MKIKLNDKVGIDLNELIVSRMLIQANSGGGKSWAIRRIIEQAFGLLAQKNYVVPQEGAIQITSEGVEAAGHVDPLPMGRELGEHYVRTLPEGEAKVLRTLLENDGSEMSREQISEATGYQRSTRDKYIYLLCVRQLVNMRGNLIKVSDHLL